MGILSTIHFANEEGETTHTHVVDTRSLQEAQANARDRIDVYADRLLRAGRIVVVQSQEKQYQIDDDSQAAIARHTIQAMAALSGFTTWDPEFRWIAADNSQQPMTAADMVAFSIDISNYLGAIARQRRLLKDQVRDLDSNAACDAFDCSRGWPINL